MFTLIIDGNKSVEIVEEKLKKIGQNFTSQFQLYKDSYATLFQILEPLQVRVVRFVVSFSSNYCRCRCVVQCYVV